MTHTVLDTNVLVLNRFYMAVRVVNVRRALTLLFRDCAEVISHDNGQFAGYDFESWCELSRMTSLEKQPREEYLQAVGFELQYAPSPGCDKGTQPIASLCLRLVERGLIFRARNASDRDDGANILDRSATDRVLRTKQIEQKAE